METVSTKPRGNRGQYVCFRCLHIAEPGRERDLFLALAPTSIALIYTALRFNRATPCPACGEKSFIPVDSSRGIELVQLEEESFGAWCKRVWPFAIAIGVMVVIVCVCLWQAIHR